MTSGKQSANQPLSPHLQIYRPLVTMMMSIMHRITGVGLYLGMAFFTYWIVALASGPDVFATAQSFYGSAFGLLILFGFTWALMHHMLGGIRHFIWDFGYGYSAKQREGLAWATIIGSIGLTIIIWGVAFLGGVI